MTAQADVEELLWQVIDRAAALVDDGSGRFILVSEPIFRQRAEEELATSAGYLPPEERAELLETCVADV